MAVSGVRVSGGYQSRSVRFVWVAVALVAAGIAAAPTLVAWWYRSDYLWTSHESMAYRFFYAQRWLEREPTDLFLPQGYLTSLVHMLVYLVVVGEHPDSAGLSEAIYRWAVTCGLVWHAVLAIALMVFVSRPYLDVTERIAGIFAAVAPLLCTGPSGFPYLLSPDYYLVGSILAAITVLLFVVVMRRPELSLGAIALLGAWAGLLASNKVSWLLFGFLPLAPVAVSRLRQVRCLVVTIAVAAAGAIAAFCLIHVAVYGGDVVKVVRIAPVWLRYIQSFGSEPDFWKAFVVTYLVNGNLAWISLAALLMTAVVLARVRGRQLLIVVAIMAVGSLAYMALVRRPAGTTTFETLIMLLALTAMLIGGSWHKDQVLRWGGYLCLAGFAVLSWWTFRWAPQFQWVSTSSNQTVVRWEIHRAIVASGRPAVVILPADDYGFSSVEQALLKGFTRPGEVGIHPGNPGIERLVPAGMTIRVEQGGDVPLSAPYPPSIALVLFERLDRERLADKYPAIAEAVRSAGDHCVSWQLPPTGLVTLCQTA